MVQTINANEELITFLRMRGHSYGMKDPQLSNWIRGMSDEQKSRKFLDSCLIRHPVSPEQHCLDLGCGFGSLVVALAERFKKVSGIDIISERVDWARRRCPTAEIACGTAEQLPWPDNHFGFVMSIDVFEHLNHDQQLAAAREIARVLKRGGQGCITVPNRFQVLDEENYILFGTWLPDQLRQRMSLKLHGSYTQAWERSEREWRRVFESAGLAVNIESQRRRSMPFIASRFRIFLLKPISCSKVPTAN